MTDTTPEHLVVTKDPRGITRLPQLQGSDGETVGVYESSNAEGPHLWLRLDDDRAELPVAEAIKLAEQLVLLVQNHYQGPIDIGQLLQVDVSVSEAATILGCQAERIEALMDGDDNEVDFSRVGPVRRPYLASLLDYKRADDAGLTE